MKQKRLTDEDEEGATEPDTSGACTAWTETSERRRSSVGVILWRVDNCTSLGEAGFRGGMGGVPPEPNTGTGGRGGTKGAAFEEDEDEVGSIRGGTTLAVRMAAALE